MPSADIKWPVPLIRQKIFYPGQFGVPGTDNTRGLRTDVGGVIIYVDPNATGVSDARDGTDPEAPLATVAQALTLVRPYRGDVIAVMANGAWVNASGLFRTTPVAEEVTIAVPGIRLVGIFPSSGLGVLWTPASNGGTCITVTAMDVTIEGFLFSEGAFTGCDAIDAEWDGATLFADNLVVRNCYFDDTVDTAIQLEFSWYCDIHHNVFSDCDVYGIFTDAAGSGCAFCQIHHNWFQDVRGTAAIALLGGADDNEIYENRIYNQDAENGAVATNEGINLTGGSSNLVHHNTLSCLLPVPANGDYDDLNSASASDAWIHNFCLDGPSVTNPT
jgi:hypothetical protein